VGKKNLSADVEKKVFTVCGKGLMGLIKSSGIFCHILSYPQSFLLLQEPVKTQDPILGAMSLVLSSFVINYLNIN